MILGVLVLVVIGGVLLLGNSSSDQQSFQETVEEPEANMQSNDTIESTDSEAQANLKEFTIESRGLSFTPDEIRVNVGDTVRIKYKNTVGTHDFTIEELGVQSSLIDAGEEATVQFVADKAGAYEFFCSVPGHREAGMKGTLVVE
ncbi:MAG: hypothetical protein ACD_50C00112G0004 [uncultured bacterium]|nr:MAG: hypothetical protein ACD_50C00112G0004 [uncultured bacterium]